MKSREVIFEDKKFVSLNVSCYGHEKCEPLHTFSHAYPGFYLLHYVKKGRGKFCKNGKCMNVEKNHIFIIRPGDVCSYSADEEFPWEYYWIHVSGELASRLDNLDDVVELRTTIFEEMDEAKNLISTRAEFLTGKAYELLSVLFENASSVNNYVAATAQYIKANYSHRLRVDEIAASLNLNKKYLSRIFRAEKGVSIQEYIIKYKIKKASEFLKRGFSVNESAKLVGYDDAFAFSKIFKKYTGSSPKEIKMAP